MREIGYLLNGFLTVHTSVLRVPLSGSLALRADLDSGVVTGDLTLSESTIRRAFRGADVFAATVRITAGSRVVGGIDREGRVFATVMVDAVISPVRVGGRTLINGGSCRTAAQALVPLRSQPGFDLERGGRLTGRYQRPRFTGCGMLTPLINMLIPGPGNTAVVDLTPAASAGRRAPPRPP